MKVSTILWVIEMVGKYGVPAVRAVINTWEIGNRGITGDDFKELEEQMKKPQEYFEK